MGRSTKIGDIAADLERRIRSDEFPANSHLPSTGALGEHYDAADGTITAAVKILARKGLVTPVRSYGTVVLDWRRPRQVRRKRAVYKDDVGYYFDQIAKGWRPPPGAKSVVTWEPASDHLAELLNIPAGSEVLIRERVVGDEVDMGPGRKHINVQQVVSTVVPADIARPLDLGREDTGQGGVLARLEEAYGQCHFEDVCYSRFPTKAEAATLQLGSGDAPILGIAVVMSDDNGRVVAVNDCRLDGRRWMVGHSLKRSTSARENGK